MQRWRQSLPKEAAPTVIDFGCGVTFFPFVVSRLGCQVVGIDNDPVCQQDLDRAAKTIDAKPGEVSSRLSENGRIPGADASIDAIYSVSVLEHIPACEKFIPELARLLKPSGLLVLTIDMDLRGDQEIGVQGYRRLRDALDQFFDLTVPEVTAHPADLLKTSNGPFPIAMDSVPKHLIKKWIAGPLRGRQPKPRLAYDLAVMGIVARKK
jgi:SAM-dependent methyltransferase